MTEPTVDDASIQQLIEDGSTSRLLFRACLLLVLEEHSGHGYGLVARLAPLGIDRDDASKVYRALRWLEGAGFVHQSWHTSGPGPARRVYELTAPGRQALEVSVPALSRRVRSVEGEMARHVRRRLRALAQEMQVFEFTVEARLAVDASDEARARRKLERVFGKAHVLAADVRATGGVAIRVPQMK